MKEWTIRGVILWGLSSAAANENGIENYFLNLGKRIKEWTESPEVITTQVDRSTVLFTRAFAGDSALHTLTRTNSRGVGLTTITDGEKSGEAFPNYTKTDWFRGASKRRNLYVGRSAQKADRLTLAHSYYVREGKKFGGVIAVDLDLRRAFARLYSGDPEPVKIVWKKQIVYSKNWVDELATSERVIEAYKGFRFAEVRYKNVVVSKIGEVQADSNTPAGEVVSLQAAPIPDGAAGASLSGPGKRVELVKLIRPVKVRLITGLLFLVIALFMVLALGLVYNKIKGVSYLDHRKLRFYYFVGMFACAGIAFLASRLIVQAKTLERDYQKRMVSVETFIRVLGGAKEKLPLSPDQGKGPDVPVLKSVIGSSSEYAAVVSYRGKYFRLSRGDSLTGQRVASIDERGVTLERAGKSVTLGFF